MYRFFLICALLLVFGVFGPATLEAQDGYQCCHCAEDGDRDAEGPR